jgi:hypothetical protein
LSSRLIDDVFIKLFELMVFYLGILPLAVTTRSSLDGVRCWLEPV